MCFRLQSNNVSMCLRLQNNNVSMCFRLQSNNRAIYQYCPIPLITYPSLEHELFCDIYYLR